MAKGEGARFKRVEVVVNVASGSVDPEAPDEIARMLADHGLAANVCAPATCDLTGCVRAAVDTAPDLLIVLAGDGTARCAAEMCGMEGPILAPLPGGTMNMLPHAVYGVRSWQDALKTGLEEGEVQTLSGGQIEGHRFLVSAILGSPALWAPAREAIRERRGRLAFLRARRALRRAFTGSLRYSIDGAGREKAEALVFMAPLTSKVLDDEERVLEAAAFNLSGAGELVRLGFNALVRDWRDDPAVDARRCVSARVSASQAIPALLDGEPVRLRPSTEVRHIPALVRVLAIPKDQR